MSTKYSRVNSKLSDVFSRARDYHLSHEQMCERAMEVYNSKDYAGITGYEREYLRGLWDARMDELYRSFLVWKVLLDGALVHGKDVPDGRWKDCDSGGGRFVWREDETRIFS